MSMKAENSDILADKRKQNGQILMMISNYCRKHRMLDVGLRSLSAEAANAIGNEIVDMFVERVAECQKETPPDMGAFGEGNVVDHRVRHRAR